MRILFKKIVLHNFGSYTDATLDLRDKGFCLVTGKNNCVQDNALSNGSGKSFLWSGICYAITGETINGLKTNLKNINVADQDMYVILEFSCNNDEYVIKRGQDKSKYLTISKNGVDISGKTFTESCLKLEESIPDITLNLITSTVILGQGLPNKFSSFSPSGRKDLLERLTKSDFMIEDVKSRVANRQAVLSKQLREIEDGLLVNKTNLNNSVSNFEACKKELDSAVRPDFDAIIASTSTEISRLKSCITNLNEDLTDFDKQLFDLNAKSLQIMSSKNNELQSLNENYNAAKTKYLLQNAELDSNIKSLKKEISQLKSISDTCPTCGQKLLNVVKPDTTAMENDLTNLLNEKDKLSEKIAECETKKRNYEKNIDSQFNDDLNKINADLTSIKQKCSDLRKEIQALNDKMSNENVSYNKAVVDKANWDKYVSNLKISIDTLEQNIVELDNLVKLSTSAKIDIEEHLAVVKKIDTLIKRDFRGYLLTNVIAYLNNKVKDFSDIVFGTRNLDLTLDGNNLNISYCNKAMDNLSGGEKTRVDLILQLSIRNMLQNYLGINANILVLDEVTDFLDKQSCKAVMNLFEKELTTIESVFIISHHAEELDIPIDTNINVVKTADGNSHFC